LYGTAHDSASTRFLFDAIAGQATGRVTTGKAPAVVDLWLITGRLVAARAPDDARIVVERLTRGGQLTEARSRQIQGTMVDAGGPRSGHDPMLALLAEEIDNTAFERVMKDRFHENVCRFVATHDTPVLFPGELPWTDNIQTAFDTREMLHRTVLDWDTALALDDRRVLVVGPASPERDLERSAAHLIGRARSGQRSTVADLVAHLDLEAVAARVAIVRMIDRGVLADPPGEYYPRPEPEPTSAAYARTWGHGQPATTSTFDAELEGFSGELDNGRMGGISDGFSTPAHRLDRVDLSGRDLPGKDGPARQPAAQPGAPDVGFAAPNLSDRDALQKIEVTNEVLGHLCRATDLARGPARGATAIQLLVDARPRPFAPLVEGIKVSATGTLNVSTLLTNLRRRPPAEQRRLLNDCLLDLLDRALDKAADELPEDALDSLLEKVIGYRQRIGI